MGAVCRGCCVGGHAALLFLATALIRVRGDVYIHPNYSRNRPSRSSGIGAAQQERLDPEGAGKADSGQRQA